MSRFSPLAFATHGITPLGYAAFAFTLGVTAGVLIRRAVPAMAVTLAIFAAVQVAMPLWIRPHLFPPEPHDRHDRGSLQRSQLSRAPTADLHARHRPPPRPARRLDHLQRSRQRRRAAGQHHPGRLQVSPALVRRVPRLHDCLASHGIRVAVSYQPASRYWPLQWTETAIFLALALALAGYCFWRLSRRLS